jgi:hypothetical protein
VGIATVSGIPAGKMAGDPGKGEGHHHDVENESETEVVTDSSGYPGVSRHNLPHSEFLAGI